MPVTLPYTESFILQKKQNKSAVQERLLFRDKILNGERKKNQPGAPTITVTSKTRKVILEARPAQLKLFLDTLKECLPHEEK